jgi:paraquat-inducible protein B
MDIKSSGRAWGVPACMLTAILAILLVGCQSTYYSAWEKLGKHKRDLLRDQVEKTRDEQQAAKEEFKDALTRLKELTGFDGGKLEQAYKAVQSDYEQCKERAGSIQNRIEKIEDISSALFNEWEKELETYSSETLRADSRSKLVQTRQRYETLHAALERSTNAMDPVLARLKDQSLFLKHNLNAQAIGALKGEVISIEGDIQKLINEMNVAIARAEDFIQTMPAD